MTNTQIITQLIGELVLIAGFIGFWFWVVFQTSYYWYRHKYQMQNKYKKVCDACFKNIEEANKKK